MLLERICGGWDMEIDSANNWQEFAINDLKAKTNSAIAIGPFGSRMKSDCYQSYGVSVIRGNNLSDTKNFKGEFVYISEQKADELRSSNVFAGDLVFPHRGLIGEVGIVPANYNKRYVLSSSLMKLTCNRNLVEPLYLFYFFRSPTGRHELLKNTSQVGTPGIATPLTSLRSIRLKLPPLPEQKAIAHILGTLDDKIELNREMNQALEAMAQAIFKSWFVDFDPVRAKMEGRQPAGMDAATAELFSDEFEESPLGMIPKGWRFSSLGELFSKEKNCVLTGPFGSNLHASDYRSEGVPLILVKHVNAGRILDEDLPLVGKHKISELNRYRLKLGDIVFTRVGAVGRSAYVYPKYEGWFISGQTLRVRVPDTSILNSRYLAQVYLQPSFMEMVDNYALGTTRPSLNTSILQSFKFLTPIPELQNCYVQLVNPLDNQIQNNFDESRSLASIRDTLLPKLLSGEIRVKEAEKVLEALT